MAIVCHILLCRPIHSTSLEMSEVSTAPYSRTISKMHMNDFILFHPKSPNFYYKSLTFLMSDCFVTQKIFNIFVKHEYGLKMPY